MKESEEPSDNTNDIYVKLVVGRRGQSFCFHSDCGKKFRTLRHGGEMSRTLPPVRQC